jgi:predicted phage baseplate assembly protein
VALGNVVLASHGLRVVAEDGGRETVTAPAGVGQRPALQEAQVTHSQQYDHLAALSLPCAGLLSQDPRQALPEVALTSGDTQWTPRRDLLGSSSSATDFVVETEDDGTSYIRFGDGTVGRQAPPGTVFEADYRTGNGRAGNVGAGALYHIVTDDPRITSVRNPMPAQGGTDPEAVSQVRIHAPQAFRSQERAVTEADYAEVCQRHAQVQKAVATRRWTGSWHTMFVTVDRREGRLVDAAFEEEMRRFLETYRLAGHDVEIEPPVFVPLDLAIQVCVLPGYFQGQVKEALLERFSSGVLPDGVRGFWHPDNFTFGQPVYLSQVVAAAMAAPGVMWAQVLRFQRWGKPALGELEEGRIALGRLEIARLENDPNAPENGRLEFVMEGGL